MNLNSNRSSRKPLNVRAVFDVIMGLIYLVVGVILVIAKYVGIEIHFPPADVVTIFGAFSAVYGGFRIFRGIKTWREE